MSLRGFHITFVVIVTCLSAFMTWWALFWDPLSPLASMLVIAGVSGLILAPIYGRYFYRKAKALHAPL